MLALHGRLANITVEVVTYLSAPSLEILIWSTGISVQDTSQFDLQLQRSILMQDPVDSVPVVGCCEDLADDQFTSPRDSGRIVPEVGVLKEYSSILFVDADGILDRLCRTAAIDEGGVEILQR